MTEWSNAGSEELARAVLAKDRTAWVELYLLWTPRIHGFFAARLSGDPASVDDLTQETMLGAWQSLELLKKPPRRFRPWLFRIARNKLYAYVQRRVADREHVTLGLDDEVFRANDFSVGALRAAEMRADWDWFVALLGDAIDSMPVKYRKVLRTHLATGATGKDLAGLLGLTAREASRWRSEGHPQLYDTVAVTMMARGRSGRPCRGFRKMLAEAHWQSGPLGESLARTLINHVDQCKRCQEHRERLKKTLELLPVFFAILVPAEVYARIKEDTDPDDKRRPTIDPALVAAMQAPIYTKAGSGVADFLGKVAMFVLAVTLISKFAPGVLERFKIGQSRSPVGLHLWVTPGSGHTIAVAPAGMSCRAVTASDNCLVPVSTGTRVTLTVQVPAPGTDPFGPVRWLGCPTGVINVGQPCTFTVTASTSVCVVRGSSTWTAAECRRWAGG
ncbi:hypothetical protein Lesp02_23610 [Lentzea sp. NBRC 105346]|uniref:RNA polymerase sigma factor n=1 Tax=Lentzea sp. NBRC 105346 TaxID=3032205 RepID=UPI0024A0F017|nr:RNA polymerase sigma factor [Lentzea sp. NBRC 105346]GLZ30171.1 hypothetical protein Lesp02_23610 [Lentzea sp. NBRC 105346]